MNTKTLPRLRTGLLLLGMIFALCVAAIQPQAAYASVLPGTTCTAVGLVRTCDLWATTGTLTLPAGSVPASVTIWGYSETSTPDTATLPGPTLIATEGETLEINLTNGLSEATSLSIRGLSGPSDTSGAAPSGTKTYTYADLQPGTYVYEAGPTANGERQIAMGMYGVLIVRPAGFPLQAYGSASAFDDEAVLVTSEIDPALNAAPAAFDLRNFAPKYFLFNGKAYPDTTTIDTDAGRKVLLRLVNAGLENHSIGVLGLRYSVLSIDGKPFAQPHTAVAETLSAGQTADVLVSIPAAAPAGMKYAVYDSSLRLLNNGQGFGGMLTFLTVPAAVPGPDITGPSASGLTLSPNPSDGSGPVVFNAAASDLASGGNNISAAEYFVGAPGTSGAGFAMTATDAAFDSATESVTATIDPTISGLNLAAGIHNIYIHGQDSAGNWGSFNFIAMNLDKEGPATASLQATPNISKGNVDVALSGSANDTATGNSNIQAAEYFIDAAGANGSGASMNVNQVAPIASVTASIPAATINALSQGNHQAFIHSQDAFGNWGAFTSVQFSVDKTGPATSGLLLRPNPNNGALAYSPSFQSVRLDATFSEPGAGPVTSTVANAEFFIDAVGADGTGILMTPNDGLFNGVTENGYTYIPLITVNALAEGPHLISVHGKDAAGNWGPFTTTTLTIDKTVPTVVSIVRASANPTGAATVNFTVTFSETVLGVDGFDFSLTPTGAVTGASIVSVSGVGVTRTVTVNTGTGAGTLRLDVTDNDTIKDSASNRLGGTGAGNGNFTTGEAYTLDKPTVVSINRASANPTTAANVNFTVTFSETVTGVNTADFSLTTTGLVGASITSVSGSGATRTVAVNTGTGTGTIRLDLVDDDTIMDTSSFRLGGTGAGNGNFATGQVYSIDRTAPTVVSIVRASPNPTTASTVNFTVTFSESVIGVDQFDFSLINTGTMTGTSIISVGGVGIVRTVTVNTGTGSGTLRLDLIDNDTIRDLAANRLGGLGAGNGNYTTGQIYNVR
ncbi:MAG: multicopper oxidase domain-containing protein [Chloroflexi bacterium]|nr:multicopper oxidase domain-containing protein [Chloroflexota bacterium]